MSDKRKSVIRGDDGIDMKSLTKRGFFGFFASLPFVGAALAAISNNRPPYERLTVGPGLPHLIRDDKGRYSVILTTDPEIVTTGTILASGYVEQDLEVWDNGSDLIVIRHRSDTPPLDTINSA